MAIQEDLTLTTSTAAYSAVVDLVAEAAAVRVVELRLLRLEVSLRLL